jgi:hypothetical protein
VWIETVERLAVSRILAVTYTNWLSVASHSWLLERFNLQRPFCGCSRLAKLTIFLRVTGLGYKL